MKQHPDDNTVHCFVPSPFCNRGPNDGGEYHNYGRLEYDILHNVSAAVYAMAAKCGSKQMAQEHAAAARKLLDVLDEKISQFPDGWRFADVAE